MAMDWIDAEMAKAKSRAKYDRNNTWNVSVKLNYKTDKDIIEYLQGKGNRQGTIKEALRLMIAQEEKMV